jgi:putative transposase
MPRRPRLFLDGVPLHVVQRGHNREPCFFTQDDYSAYLYWLNEALVESKCALHAYVLMTNHVHLLLTPQRAKALPDVFVSLGRRYVQYINRSYRRTGTLWDSRYKSSLVQAETYLLVCQRYIELNPVRAAMVDDPAHYRWTSYRASGLGQEDLMLTCHPIYLALGGDGEKRRASYRALFRAHLDQTMISDIRLALNQDQPLGDSRFREKIAQMAGIRREARKRGRPRKGVDSTGCDPDMSEIRAWPL